MSIGIRVLSPVELGVRLERRAAPPGDMRSCLLLLLAVETTALADQNAGGGASGPFQRSTGFRTGIHRLPKPDSEARSAPKPDGSGARDRASSSRATPPSACQLVLRAHALAAQPCCMTPRIFAAACHPGSDRNQVSSNQQLLSPSRRCVWAHACSRCTTTSIPNPNPNPDPNPDLTLTLTTTLTLPLILALAPTLSRCTMASNPNPNPNPSTNTNTSTSPHQMHHGVDKLNRTDGFSANVVAKSFGF